MINSSVEYPLVARLRTMAAIGWNPIGSEAADEIELLRSQVNVLVTALNKAAMHVRPTCFELYEELQATISPFKEPTK